MPRRRQWTPLALVLPAALAAAEVFNRQRRELRFFNRDARMSRAAGLPDDPAVVSRRQKLVAAGAVLGVGLTVALLFRRGDESYGSGTEAAASPTAELPPLVTSTSVPMSLEGQFSPRPPVPATTVSSAAGFEPPVELPTTAASAASPAVAVEPMSLATQSVEAPLGRPVYAVEDLSETAPSAVQSGYHVHVIHNGDTLERLAERYLADGARALELFDLNRDVLENPHLLPLGVQLRIPTGTSAAPVAE